MQRGICDRGSIIRGRGGPVSGGKPPPRLTGIGTLLLEEIKLDGPAVAAVWCVYLVGVPLLAVYRFALNAGFALLAIRSPTTARRKQCCARLSDFEVGREQWHTANCDWLGVRRELCLGVPGEFPCWRCGLGVWAGAGGIFGRIGKIRKFCPDSLDNKFQADARPARRQPRASRGSNGAGPRHRTQRDERWHDTRSLEWDSFWRRYWPRPRAVAGD
jgi:hypothetical protein